MAEESSAQPDLKTPPGPTDELLPLVYDELRRISQEYLRALKPGFTLCPTELVHEACLHLLRYGRGEWTSPEHFRAIATRKIWQVIVDHLRHRTAAKRGGTPLSAAKPDSAEGAPAKRQRLPIESIMVEWQPQPVELLDLADALEALGQQSSRLHEVVMLHWFGGLKYSDVAQILGISSSSAEKDFRFALAWLGSRMKGEPDGG